MVFTPIVSHAHSHELDEGNENEHKHGHAHGHGHGMNVIIEKEEKDCSQFESFSLADTPSSESNKSEGGDDHGHAH
tara:strand:+ start:171 stop:398 length:228 start_codon:yes stop_codon:yes gene_type:complete